MARCSGVPSAAMVGPAWRVADEVAADVGSAGPLGLLQEDELLGRGGAPAAVLLRPGDAGVAGVEQAALPAGVVGPPGRPVVAAGARRAASAAPRRARPAARPGRPAPPASPSTSRDKPDRPSDAGARPAGLTGRGPPRPPPAPATAARGARRTRAGPSVWSGWPHIDTRSAAPALQASVSPSSSAPPQRPLGRRHRGRRVAGHRLGQRLGLLPQPLRRVDHLADHPQLVGPLPPASARAGRRGPSASPPRPASCACSPIASSDTTWPIDTWGSRNWASDGGDHDVGVGHPVEPAARADAVDRGDDRLPHPLVPGGEVQVEVLHRSPVALHAHAVGGDLGHVDAGLEGPALAGVDDHPDLGVGVELPPGDRRTRRASCCSWR